MSYIKNEYMEYLYNIGGIINPGSYVYYLRRIEDTLDVDIDAEYAKDGGKSLYDTLQRFRKNPENTGENEVFFRQCASRLKKYIGFRDWAKSQDAQKMLEAGSRRNSLGDADVRTIRYWMYTPEDGIWTDAFNNNFMALNSYGLGNLSAYESKEALEDQLKAQQGNRTSYASMVHMLWQFAHEMNQGDVVYVKRGPDEIIGRGIVESDYSYDQSSNSKTPHLRSVKWTNQGKWIIQEKLNLKVLDEITNYTSLVKKLNSLFETDGLDRNEQLPVIYPPYSMEDFLKEVYIDETTYNAMVNTIINKKNIILQGAPGVGKTFLAKRLAYSIMGEKDVSRVTMVQFHQSYTYEDFIMGFRPSYNGFELKKGVFYNFCKKAEIDSDRDYFFIIDEINRGNLNKIFGELFMLIENDKRGSKYKLQLLYSDELFFVPDNVFIIGMMNSADRSLAMIDYALRRRFAFITLRPGFNSEGFKRYRIGLNNRRFDALIQCVERLNERISADESLGEGFCIGHSFFCNISQDEMTNEKLYGIVEYELIPLLREYWFDDPTTANEWCDNLRRSIK